MDILFQNNFTYKDYENILFEPLNADEILINPNINCHEQKAYVILPNKIKPVEKRIIIKNLIESLYFIYVDTKLNYNDDKYWFLIGKLKNGIYFSYESGCCQTGFGLGSKSSLYLSREQDHLIKYGLTNKQRELINQYKNVFIQI
jgi:hypothetical protein